MRKDKSIKVDLETYKAIARMAKEEERTHTNIIRRSVLAREIHVRGKKEGSE